VNGNYEPENCRWIIQSEQASNTRRNVRINNKNLSQWSKKLGLNRGTLQARKQREGAISRILRPLRKDKSVNQGKIPLTV